MLGTPHSSNPTRVKLLLVARLSKGSDQLLLKLQVVAIDKRVSPRSESTLPRLEAALARPEHECVASTWSAPWLL